MHLSVRLIHTVIHTIFPGILFIAAMSQAAYGQNASVSVSSGSGIAGSPVSLPITLSSASTPTAALQWTLGYSQADIASVTVDVSSSAAAAAKSLSCHPGLGTITCVLAGPNQNIVPTGVVATAQLQIRSTASGTLPVSIAGVMNASEMGTGIPSAASGGAVSVAAAPPPTATPTLTAFQCTSLAMSGAGTNTCSVTLSDPAPAGGFSVALKSNSQFLVVPTSVTVPAGMAAATVQITALGVSANTIAQVTASAAGQSYIAAILLKPAATVNPFSSFTCSPSSIMTGESTACRLAMTSAAAAPVVVALSGSTGLAVPTSVTIPAGQVSVDVLVAGASATAAGVVTANLNGSTVAANLIVTNPETSQLSSLSCTPTALLPGGRTTCVAQLTRTATSATTVAISATGSSVSVPASVSIAAGQTSASFILTVASTAATGSVTLSASRSGKVVTTSLSIDLLRMVSLTCTPNPVVPGITMTCRLEMSAIATSDVAVRLTSVSTVLNPAATLICRTGQIAAYFFTYTEAGSAAQTAVLTATMGAQQISTNIVLAPKTTAVTSVKSVSDTATTTTLADAEPVVSEVVNAASGSDLACSSGSLASLLGAGLQANPEELPEVLVDEKPAVVVAASSSRVTFLCPSATAGTMLELTVRHARGKSKPVQTVVQDMNPGIFTQDGSGQGTGRIGRVGTEETATIAAPGILLGVPVQADDVLSILTTGITSGSKVVVMIDGIAHEVSEVSPTETLGIQSIAIRLSSAVREGDAVPVRLEAVKSNGELVTSNAVSIAVLPPPSRQQ